MVRPTGRWVSLLCVWSLLAPVTAGWGMPMQDGNEVQAAYVYNLLLAARWPPEKFVFRQGRDILCIVDPKGRFEPELFDAVRDQEIRGRPLEIRHWFSLAAVEELHGGCDIVFMTGLESKQLQRLIHTVQGGGSVTVSDAAGFTKLGGMVELRRIDRHVRLVLNKRAIARSGVRYPAQVYQVAYQEDG